MKKRTTVFLALHLLFWGFTFRREMCDCEPLYYTMVQHIGLLIVFYFNYFILVPKIVKKNKPGYYLLYILSLFGIFWIVKIFDYLLPAVNNSGHLNHSFLFSLGAVSYFSFYYGGVSTVLRLGYDLIEIEDQNRVLLMKKTNTQIQFMKSNINIPFIVQALSHLEGVAKEDPEYIKEPLLQLSSLLRYGTYDATLEKIELDKEIGILHEFIDLINQIETEYQLKLLFIEIDNQLKTIPNLLIKILSFWRDQVRDVLSCDVLIEITGSSKGINMHLPQTGNFTLENLSINFPEINNHFFNTRYYLSGNVIAVHINPVTK